MVIMDDEVLKELAYVVNSKYRVKSLIHLDNTVQTPTTLSEIAGMKPSLVSRALKEMEGHGIVECISDDDAKKARPYLITPLGEAILDMIAEDSGLNDLFDVE